MNGCRIIKMSPNQQTGTNQTLVHIVSNGNLQVKGELSEHNLANISVIRKTLTSKVYPGKNGLERLAMLQLSDRSWAGANAAGSGQGIGGAKYPFTVDITSEIGD